MIVPLWSSLLCKEKTKSAQKTPLGRKGMHYITFFVFRSDVFTCWVHLAGSALTFISSAGQMFFFFWDSLVSKYSRAARQGGCIVSHIAQRMFFCYASLGTILLINKAKDGKSGAFAWSIFQCARKYASQVFGIFLPVMILICKATVYQWHVVELNCWPLGTNQCDPGTWLSRSTIRWYIVDGMLYAKVAQLGNRKCSNRMEDHETGDICGSFHAVCRPIINPNAILDQLRYPGHFEKQTYLLWWME